MIETTIVMNKERLLHSYMRYVNSHSRYTSALESGFNELAVRHEYDNFTQAHRTLLEDGKAEFDNSTGEVRVWLPARGRIDGSVIMDMPVYRRNEAGQLYLIKADGSVVLKHNAKGWFKFEGIFDGKPCHSEIDPEAVQLHEHIVALNEDGEGYCLLYEDHVIQF